SARTCATAPRALLRRLLRAWLIPRPIKTTVRKDAGATTATLSFVSAVLAAVCWFGAARTSENLDPAVVVEPSPRLYHAPDELSKPTHHPDLYEGAVVLIRNQSSNWTQIELAGKTKIWVKREIVVPIEPSAQP